MATAGGGIKGGVIYGATTDDYGYHVVENKVEIHDFCTRRCFISWAFDHKRLTYRFGGAASMRLTDVHGEVVSGVMA